METDLERFAGGLRVFWVLVLINFLLAFFAAGYVVSHASGRPLSFVVTEISIAVIFAGLMAAILMVVKQRSEWVPKRLLILGVAALALVFAESFISAWLTLDHDIAGTWNEAYEYPRGTMWLLFFIAYFMSSERVRVYYGTDPRAETQKDAEKIPGLKEMGLGYASLLLGLAVVIVPVFGLLWLIIYLTDA